MSGNEIKIEKGIPIPKVIRRPSKWPIDDLKVNDSFLIPSKSFSANYRHSFAGNANFIRKPKRFVSRSVPGGTRVWRVA